MRVRHRRRADAEGGGRRPSRAPTAWTWSPRSPPPSRTPVGRRAAAASWPTTSASRRTILRHLAEIATVEVVPASTPAADVLGPRARRRVPVQRPRRPRRRDLRHRRHRRPARRTSRSSASASATSCSATALGGTTYKLPFGHHGGNHPVQHLADGRGRDHQPEPQLRGGRGLGRHGRRHPREPERRRGRGPALPRRRRLQRAVPPRGRPRPPRRPLPVRGASAS